MNLSLKKLESLEKEVFTGLENLEKKPEVKEILFAGGYKEADLADIKEMQVRLNGLYKEKESKNRTKISLSARIEELRARLNAHYGDTAVALKLALEKAPSLLADLGLSQSILKRTVPFLERARDLYLKAGAGEVLAKTVGYGLSAESLAEGVQIIDDIEALQNERHHLNSEKESLTAQRNAVYRELRKKWRSLTKTLIRLFRDEPHAVEGVIDVPSYGFFKPRRKKPEDGDSEPDEPGADDPGPEDPGPEEPGDES